MKVPQHIIDRRREKLESLVSTHRYLSLKELCERLRISEATARRDLAALQKAGRITRTHGGALSDFNDRFPSFTERKARCVKSKTQLAQAALQLIQPGGVYFFDSGTTIAYLAEALAAQPVGSIRVLTVNLPVAEILAPHREIEVFLTGGQMLQRQSILLGDAVTDAIVGWNFDMAFLSAEGMDAEGLWNSQLAIVAHQHAVVRRARRNLFLLDATKFGRRAAHFLLPWPAVDCVLTDVATQRIEALSSAAAKVHWHPSKPLVPAKRMDPPTGELPVHYL